MKKRTLALASTFVVLIWLANAATVVFDKYNYEYSDNIKWSQFIPQVVTVNPIAVATGLFSAPSLFSVVNLIMFITLAAVVAIDVTAPTNTRLLTGLVAAVAGPLGALALFSLAESLQVGIDGEWIGEGWPVLEMFGPWSIALACYAVATAVWHDSPAVPTS